MKFCGRSRTAPDSASAAPRRCRTDGSFGASSTPRRRVRPPASCSAPRRRGVRTRIRCARLPTARRAAIGRIHVAVALLTGCASASSRRPSPGRPSPDESGRSKLVISEGSVRSNRRATVPPREGGSSQTKRPAAARGCSDCAFMKGLGGIWTAQVEKGVAQPDERRAIVWPDRGRVRRTKQTSSSRL